MNRKSRSPVLVLASTLAIALVAISLAQPFGKPPSSSESVVQRGYAIAPVPLDLKGKNRSLVGQGSYIVNAQGACNDCHTCPPYAPGHDPFQGQPEQVNPVNYLAGGRPFGPFTSRNITPDAQGRPAGLTFEEFVTLLRTGVDPDQEHLPIPLLQVMPWPIYRHMTDRDLRAVYEYLRSIPHAEPGDCGAG